jgi:MYXO-CTERM domain-containing protein
MRLAVALLGAALLFTATPAMADEREDLMRQLGQEYDALSTSDCVSACRALASMQRAAERICALDPGASCAEARAKVADAEKRVRAACPACAVERPPQPTPPAPEATVASAPPAESKRGGCAGCSAGAARGDAFAALLAAAWLFARRRRRR